MNSRMEMLGAVNTEHPKENGRIRIHSFGATAGHYINLRVIQKYTPIRPLSRVFAERSLRAVRGRTEKCDSLIFASR